jgi:hypothetical protein
MRVGSTVEALLTAWARGFGTRKLSDGALPGRQTSGLICKSLRNGITPILSRNTATTASAPMPVETAR